MEIFKYQKPEFYAELFDGTKEGPFEVTPVCKNVGVTIKPVLGATKLYVFQDINIACVFC